MKENQRKCAKCCSSPADDPDTKLYRFPKPGSTNILRCELWAKYCFPDKSWSAVDFQSKLHSEHRMLCHRHFKESAFVDYPSKKLRRFASPDVEEVTMPHLVVHMEAVAGPSHQAVQPLQDISNMPSDDIPGPSASVQNPVNKLTDGKEHAFEKCKVYLQKISKLQRKLRYMKNKKFMHKLCTNNAVSALSKKISPTFTLLLQAQIKNFKKSPKGRRWTSDDKITALRLYKRSPTCYKLLRRMFSLPAPTTLKALLRKCVLNVGINKHIFEIIGKFAKAIKPADNEFILMFDEMSIRRHLQYNAKEDAIEGFQDHGEQGRSSQPASYALVFMVAGIRRKIKQPIAFYISGSSVTADRLAVLIKQVLEQCHKYGVNIAATVCDMDGVNRRALTILGATASSPYFEANDHEIIALFDPPHLIKCFRNLFLKYDIECPTDISSDGRAGTGIAKWSHIVEFHNLDSANPNFAYAPLLKPDHLNPNTKQKMKVKLAVQVLSHTVSSGIYARIGKGLSNDAVVTADVLSKMDKIFDSLNSDSVDLRRGKPFSTNPKDTTPHLEFINKMKYFFQNIKFIGATRTPPSQEGWLWTLNGVERLWRTLRQKHNTIKSLATRRLQQDPLENLFGCIRANCGANCNPTTGQFVGALKTTLLSNLSHIGVGNCELDSNSVIINNFKLFLNADSKESNEDETVTSDEGPSEGTVASSSWDQEFEFDEELLLNVTSEMQACAYVCGFVIKNYKNNCEKCRLILTSEDHSSIHTFIEFREYSNVKESLNYPHQNFVLCVEVCATAINNYLDNNAHKIKIRQDITIILKATKNFNFLNDCIEHKEENIDYIIKSVFYIIVKRFCIKKNRSFIQESSKSALQKKISILSHK